MHRETNRRSGRTGGRLFAECTDNPEEFLSTAVTIDCNESLRLKVGDIIVHSNLYRPLPRVVRDDAGRHDLLFPGCRRETYDFFYRNGEGHPNCYDNINGHMERRRPIIRPLNLFMNTRMESSRFVRLFSRQGTVSRWKRS